MPNVTVEMEFPIEIFCQQCGGNLSSVTEAISASRLVLPPCQKCVDDARLKAEKTGYDEGRRAEKKQFRVTKGMQFRVTKGQADE